MRQTESRAAAMNDGAHMYPPVKGVRYTVGGLGVSSSGGRHKEASERRRGLKGHRRNKLCWSDRRNNTKLRHTLMVRKGSEGSADCDCRLEISNCRSNLHSTISNLQSAIHWCPPGVPGPSASSYAPRSST